MTIYISTNLYKPQQLREIFPLMDKLAVPAGIEIFPEWQSEIFRAELEQCRLKFRKHAISLHGPYYGTEHSKPENTREYGQSMLYFEKTFELAKDLKAKYIVYHHNNCRTDGSSKKAMIEISSGNLARLRQRARAFAAEIVVENAGVLSHGNMLFDQDEFIEMAENIPEKILLDIGHAHANGWNIELVMKKLSQRIIAYHVHNNDGYEDKHDRIFNGTLNFAEFMCRYKKYTPQADIVVEYGRQCSQDTEGIAADVDYISRAMNAEGDTPC